MYSVQISYISVTWTELLDNWAPNKNRRVCDMLNPKCGIIFHLTICCAPIARGAIVELIMG